MQGDAGEGCRFMHVQEELRALTGGGRYRMSLAFHAVLFAVLIKGGMFGAIQRYLLDQTCSPDASGIAYMQRICGLQSYRTSSVFPIRMQTPTVCRIAYAPLSVGSCLPDLMRHNCEGDIATRVDRSSRVFPLRFQSRSAR